MKIWPLKGRGLGHVTIFEILRPLGSRQSYIARLIYANGTVRVDHIRVDSNHGSLHIDSVTDDTAGVYRCEDKSEAAFAELHVVGERVFTMVKVVLWSTPDEARLEQTPYPFQPH